MWTRVEPRDDSLLHCRDRAVRAENLGYLLAEGPCRVQESACFLQAFYFS